MSCRHQSMCPAQGCTTCLTSHRTCRKVHTGMVGARPPVAWGRSKSFAVSGMLQCQSFAPARHCLKVRGAEARQFGAHCPSSLMNLFCQICFHNRKRNPTTSPRPLCSLHWGLSRVAGKRGCISAGLSSMQGSRLTALVPSRVQGHPALLTMGGCAGCAGCGCCSSSSLATARQASESCCWQCDALTMVRKSPPKPHVPWLGHACREALGITASLQAGWVPGGVVKVRVGREGSRKVWDGSICPREEEAVGIGIVPMGLCTGQLPSPLCGS